ncbi:MAG: YehR family protein [Microbacteriaceae bacterium]
MPQLAVQTRSTKSFVTPLVLLIVSFLAFALTACSGVGVQTVSVYQQTQNGVDMTITYYANGDEVTKQSTVNVMNYAGIGLSGPDEARKLLDPIMAEFQGVTGLEHSVEYGDTAVTERMTVDYSIADIKEISELTGSSFEGVGDGKNVKLSLKQSVALLEKSGFKKTN